jgi:hypothetical protein
MEKCERYNKFNDFLKLGNRTLIYGIEIDPSLALYHGKLSEYQNELKKWMNSTNVPDDDKLELILSCYNNKSRFQNLKNSFETKNVIPFVGAGVSIPCGMKGWRVFLEDFIGQDMDCYDDIILMLDNGKFDDAVDKIIDTVGVGVFEDAYNASYSTPESNIQLKGAAVHLGKIFTSVVTTNFDLVIERSFRQSDKTPRVYTGLSHEGFFNDTINGHSSILKIHGDCLDRTRRILTKIEYDSHYGDRVDLDKPLVSVFDRIYMQKKLFFMGCSLSTDRTMEVFKLIKDRERRRGTETVQHIALLEDCSTKDRVNREKELVDTYGIYPIWFPPGAFSSIEIVLKAL